MVEDNKVKSFGTRSSKEQLKDELAESYRKMTDPEAIEERKRKDKRKDNMKERIEDYNL